MVSAAANRRAWSTHTDLDARGRTKFAPPMPDLAIARFHARRGFGLLHRSH